jgi:hypothetical protein
MFLRTIIFLSKDVHRQQIKRFQITDLVANYNNNKIYFPIGFSRLYIVKCIPIARQRVGKHIPATHENATIGCILLGNNALNRLRQQYRLCFP